MNRVNMSPGPDSTNTQQLIELELVAEQVGTSNTTPADHGPVGPLTKLGFVQQQVHAHQCCSL